MLATVSNFGKSAGSATGSRRGLWCHGHGLGQACRPDRPRLPKVNDQRKGLQLHSVQRLSLRSRRELQRCRASLDSRAVSTRPRTGDQDIDESPRALLPVRAGRHVGDADESSKKIDWIEVLPYIAALDRVRSKYSNVHETMGDVLYAPNGCGKTLRVKCGPCNVVLSPFGMLFPG
jgi:hypothetical protein